jgi:pimeloyl-ACP methyl ester carboxylesterase
MRLFIFIPCLMALAASLVTAAENAPKKVFPPDPPMPEYTLPEVLKARAGTTITTAKEWETARRPELLELFRQHVYGRVPATPYQTTMRVVNENPRAMGGAATLREIDLTFSTAKTSLVMRLTLFVPNQGPKPAPAFLLVCNRGLTNIDPTRQQRSDFWPAEEGVARGYAMAAFYNGDIDPDRHDGFTNGIHGLLDVSPRAPDAWGTLAAWAWGASRCLDYLTTDKDVAGDKVAVIGHSRGGKTALWAAAEDPRFAMAIANDSGCGGDALSRRIFKGRESVSIINKSFPHWFCENFKAFNEREQDLPVDQHMLLALIAPRAVATGSAEGDIWADPRGQFLSATLARPVYQLYGKGGLGKEPAMPAIGEALHGEGLHYHIREGKHNLTLGDWQSYWDFADQTWQRKNKP